jgi:hypothetical protein
MRWAALGAVVALAACGTRARTGETSSVRAPGAPLNGTVVLVAAEGKVEVRAQDGASWTTLTRATAARNVVAIRTSGGGAVLDLGEGRHVSGSAGAWSTPGTGRLWLKDDTSIDLGQDDKGAVRVLVAKGEARLRQGARDDLFYARGGETQQIETRKNLAEADFSLELETERDPAGVGTLQARNANGQIAAVSLKRVSVKGKQAGDFAETEVEHLFSNETDQRLEGTFRFPLPSGAMLTGLAMEIDEKLMEGELVEREKAEKVYQEIVDSMQDPALLEWEHGNVFKLRVFPIEPRKDKRVVLRYVAPLHRGVDGWEYLYPATTSDPAAKRAAFHVEFGGKNVLDVPFEAAHDVVVPLGGAVPEAVRETRGDAVYTAIRVRPDWSKVAEPKGDLPPRRLVIIVDTSRSTLEEHKLELDALGIVLGELRPEDAFVTIASDVVARPQAGELSPATPEAIEKATAFVSKIEPDGASDLGVALRQAGRIAKLSREKDGKEVEILYVGDGTPTWGETKPEALAKIAKDTLGGAPVHALVLGSTGDVEAMRDLVAASGGQLDDPKTALDTKRFALRLAQRPIARRISHARVAGRDKEIVFPSREVTLVEGDEIVAVVKTPKGEPAPTQIQLVGQVDEAGHAGARPGGREFTQAIPIGKPEPATHVAQRWAKDEILALEKDGVEKKDEVVRASLDFGIMSRYTSFLVLESEEAYAKYEIERKKAKEQAEALAQAGRVTGGDLESVSGRNARLEPDHLQPGDPEIHVPAPADAQSVVVVFPFGETKVATYEAGGINAWTVRFLIDKDTPDGTYEVLVRITHKDGSLEVLKLPYVVDTKKPTVQVTLHAVPGRPGAYEIRATQVITMTEIQAASPGARGSVDELRKRYAKILTDAYRVEVRLPDGEVLPLTAIRLGEFRAQWKPDAPLAGPVTLHVVAVDRAMNQSAFDATLAVK